MTRKSDILNIDEFNVQEEVIDFSIGSIVVLLFWAQWSKDSLTVKKRLEELFANLYGPVRLGLVNIDASPVVASQFAIFSLPTVKIFFQGKIENTLNGIHPTETYLNALKSVHEINPFALLLQKGEALRAEGDSESAESVLIEYLEVQPSDSKALYLLAQTLLDNHKYVDAYYLLKDFPAGKYFSAAEVLFPLAKTLMKYTNEKIVIDKNDFNSVQFGASLRLLAENKFYLGIESLFSLLRKDKKYGKGLAKKLALAAIERLDEDDPKKEEYRAEFSTLVF